MIPGNRSTLDLWAHAQGQWRSSGFGLVGLDLPAVFSVAQILGIPINPPMLHKLRMIEAAVLAAQAKKKSPTRED